MKFKYFLSFLLSLTLLLTSIIPLSILSVVAEGAASRAASDYTSWDGSDASVVTYLKVQAMQDSDGVYYDGDFYQGSPLDPIPLNANVTSMLFTGYAGVKGQKGMYGYTIDNQAPVFNDSFGTDVPHEAMKKAILATGADVASMISITVPTTGLTGEHTLTFLYKTPTGTTVGLKVYHLLFTDPDTGSTTDPDTGSPTDPDTGSTTDPTPDTDPAENWLVDLTQYADQANYKDSTPNTGIPHFLLGYGQSISLGKIDLSPYKSVKITYSFDGSEATEANFNSTAPHAIGLKSAAGSYGEVTATNFADNIAYTNMVFSSKGWTDYRVAQVDLSTVTHNGDVYVAVHNPAGTNIAISGIEFIANDLAPTFDITIEKTEFVVGESIPVTAYGSGDQWVGLYRKDDLTDKDPAMCWYTIDNEKYTSGQTVDITTLPLNRADFDHLPAGEYRLVLFSTGDYTAVKEIPITITSRLHVEKTDFLEGKAIPVTVDPGYTADEWVGIYAAEDDPRTIGAIYRYHPTEQSADKAVNIRGISEPDPSQIAEGREWLPAGNYKIILFADDTHKVIEQVNLTIAADPAPITFRGIQHSDLSGATFDVRFAATLNSVDYKKVGFKITETTYNKYLDAHIQTVYESLNNAVGATYTAAELGGQYIAAAVIKGIPTGGTLRFAVTPYVENSDGSIFLGESWIVTITATAEGVVSYAKES